MFVRPTARLVVLDPDDRVLLFRVELEEAYDPGRTRVVWATPGGGVEDGETFQEAALRELREETGLAPAALGPCVLERDILLRERGREVLYRTRFFSVRVDAGAVSLGEHDSRWWSLRDLRRTDESVFPEDLPTFLQYALSIA